MCKASVCLGMKECEAGSDTWGAPCPSAGQQRRGRERIWLSTRTAFPPRSCTMLRPSEFVHSSGKNKSNTTNHWQVRLQRRNGAKTQRIGESQDHRCQQDQTGIQTLVQTNTPAQSMWSVILGLRSSCVGIIQVCPSGGGERSPRTCQEPSREGQDVTDVWSSSDWSEWKKIARRRAKNIRRRLSRRAHTHPGDIFMSVCGRFYGKSRGCLPRLAW